MLLIYCVYNYFPIFCNSSGGCKKLAGPPSWNCSAPQPGAQAYILKITKNQYVDICYLEEMPWIRLFKTIKHRFRELLLKSYDLV